ncbi:MAG: oligosaccharide flippase family protein [Pseudomonadota bacterium]
MRRFDFTKNMIEKFKTFRYAVKELIRWMTKKDFYAARLQCGDCSIGVIGRHGVINDLVQVFQSEDPLIVLGPMGRKKCLKNSGALGSTDIFLREIPPWQSAKKSDDFIYQPLIEQCIDLTDGFDAFFAGVDRSQRPRVKESITAGDTVELSDSPEDIETFYNHFLLPTAKAGHGSHASIPPLQDFLNLSSENCLLHIKDSAGVIQFTAFIFKKKNSEWRLLRTGVNDQSQLDKRRNGVLRSRCYVEVAHYAIDSGQKSLSLGLSPAAAGNGIFGFKEDFNAYYSHKYLVYPRFLGSAQTPQGAEKMTELKLLVRPCIDPSKLTPFKTPEEFTLGSNSKNAPDESHVRVVNTFLHMGIASAITSVMGLALKIALPRMLGTTQMGQLYFAESMAAIFFGFMPLGIASYIAREVPKNPEGGGGILSTVIPFQLIFAAILALSMHAFLHFSVTDSVAQQCGFAFAVFSAAMVLQRYIVGRTYIALGKSAIIASNEIWTRVILLFIVAAAIFWKPTAVTVAWSYAIAHVIGISLLLRKSYTDKMVKWSPDYSRFKEIVWTSLPFFAVSALIEIYGNVDIAMLNYFSNGDEVAFYGSANKLKGAALVFLPIFQAAVQPALARTWFENRENFATFVSHAMRIVVALSLPIVILMVLIPDYLATTIFGAEFAKSSLAIACVAPILILSSLNVLMGSCLNVISNGVSFLIVTTISVLMNAVLNAIAISYSVGKFGPGAGAAAAAIATVISETFVLVAMRRIFKVGLDQKQMWLIMLASIAPCVIIGANYQALLSVSPYLRMGAAAILVPLYMYVVKLLRPGDIRWIINTRRHK